MILYRYNITKDVNYMPSSRVRDSPPAILEPFPPSLSRFFEIHERLSVFDDIYYQRMRERPTYKIVVLEGQVSFYE